MSSVHYFQRYSTKENSVTNTMLHLFAQIYEHSPSRLRGLLTQITEQDIALGVGFSQQNRSGASVPDAMILQEPVQIAIETKVEAGVNQDQLFRHCESFKREHGNYLFLVTRDEVPAVILETVRGRIRDGKSSCMFMHFTFERLVAKLKDSVANFEVGLNRMVEDFCAYCEDMELLPDRRILMRVVPCGETIALNAQRNVYYQPSSRSYSDHSFIGIYNNKAIQYVGKILAIVDATLTGGRVVSAKYVIGSRDPMFEANIEEIVRDTVALIGWDISSGYRFFCVDRFEPTNYRKESKGGIQGPRIFDISRYMESNPSTEQLAGMLRDKIWGSEE